MVDGNLGPVFLKDAAGVFLDFAEGDGLKPARAFKAEAEAADTAEQVEHAELGHSAASLSCLPSIFAR